VIRPRRGRDSDALVALLRAVYISDGYPSNWPSDPSGWLSGRRTIRAWVREEQDELLGHVALTAPDRDRAWPEWQQATGVRSERLAVLRRLFVAPDRRRGGVGAGLVEVAEREAASRGLQPVLDVGADNATAIAFWRNRRWREVGQASLPPGDEGRPLQLLLFVAPTVVPK
jgi:GNAT superfamily N-acetyltransferase